MAQSLPNPPPGFDSLSVEEKIEYVQALWDAIVDSREDVPVPEWHREIIRDRLAEHRANPDAGRAWSDVRSEIEQKLSSRR
jgi:putative addiction module component (TIGR02574 family)